MEEIIEQLREANEPVPVPLELPDEDLLVEIEEQLFIDIPFVFKEFLLTVSDVVYGSLEPVTVTDPQSHTYLPDVAANASAASTARRAASRPGMAAHSGSDRSLTFHSS